MSEVVKTGQSEVTTAKEEFAQFSEIFDNLKDLKPAPISDTKEYLELKEQQEVRAMFVYLGEMPSTQKQTLGEMITAAVFVKEDGTVVYSMASVLVQTCIEKEYKKFTPLLIKRLEDGVNGDRNKYHRFSITRLI
jgi:hypothetical protein